MIFLRFKINKFILLLLGFLFFPHILDQISFFFLVGFKKIKKLSTWSYLSSFQLGIKKYLSVRDSKFILGASNKKNKKNYI